MVISQKLTKDKRCVSDFRHMNTRITKTNLAFSLVRDMSTMLRSFKCEVLSAINLKAVIH